MPLPTLSYSFAMGLDPTPPLVQPEHSDFTRGFAKAAAFPDGTGLAAGDLDPRLRAHIAREEWARLALACAHGPPGRLEATPLDKARVAAALQAFEGFREEHVELRARVERVRLCARKDGHREVVDLCRRVLGHIALEDGIVHPLSMVQARAFLALAGGAAAP